MSFSGYEIQRSDLKNHKNERTEKNLIQILTYFKHIPFTFMHSFIHQVVYGSLSLSIYLYVYFIQFRIEISKTYMYIRIRDDICIN